MLALPDIMTGFQMLIEAIIAKIVQGAARALWNRAMRGSHAEGAAAVASIAAGADWNRAMRGSHAEGTHASSGRDMPHVLGARRPRAALRTRKARAPTGGAGNGLPPQDAAHGGGRSGGGRDTSLRASGSISWQGRRRSLSARFNVDFGISSARNARRDG